MDLSKALVNGSAAISDIIKDVEKGLAAGGGVVPEALAVAEALFADADFKAHVAALVDALKG